MKDVGDKLFQACSKRKQRGDRTDKPVREVISNLLVEQLNAFLIKPLSNKELKGQIDDIRKELKVKCDGAFQVQTGGKIVYIFYEVKGYGDNSNDVLSAITAAELVKEMPQFKESLYYYIGVNSSKCESGFTRKSLYKGIEPYIEWAENREFLWFYGIVEVDELLADIKKRLKQVARGVKK